MTTDNHNDDPSERPRFRPVPWTALETPQDVELWIDAHNRTMQELVRPQETGVGVRFTLAAGGEVYLQTTADAVILDVDPEAGWIGPLIMAATGADQPAGQTWVLADHKLVQLMLGLSTLIETSLIVTGHNFGRHGRRMA